MAEGAVKRVVILGGGSAGWLTAAMIAAEHKADTDRGIEVTLVESSNIPTVGVGEGTWPSMRATLKSVGISETEFFKFCDVAFKQGAKFAKWIDGREEDFYYHPLMEPHGFLKADLVETWKRSQCGEPFADAVCAQGGLCERGLAPKQISTPEFAAVANYAYHLDSGKFGQFLKHHCVEKLGVRSVIDDVREVLADNEGYVTALRTSTNGDLEGDLFVDCSGFASLLLRQHHQVPFISKRHILFNDTALAVHVPYVEPSDPIASHTISTAQSAGWIWDIGLPTRRGVGAVYSSDHISEDEATAELHAYIASTSSAEIASQLTPRRIDIKPGHLEKFWVKNCVAVGLSAGFLEPLEASALVLVEASARMISAEMPADKSVMEIVAGRFNRRFHHYWDTIIDFLKLHYVLTKRTDSQYWMDNLEESSITDSLRQSLVLWRSQSPNKYDFPLAEEMFPAASWQYVLYGMGFETRTRATARRFEDDNAFRQVTDEVAKLKSRCYQLLPTNRDLIDKIYTLGMSKV